MRCPFCGSVDTRVVDSRAAREGRSIRRRRRCSRCDERFTTYEVVEETMIDVVKKDGSTEPFDREKLLRSLRLACQKLDVDRGELTAFTEGLEARLAATPRRTIGSDEVGERVLAFLLALNPVAYVRYASVYRSFATVEEFMTELRKLHERES